MKSLRQNLQLRMVSVVLAMVAFGSIARGAGTNVAATTSGTNGAVSGKTAGAATNAAPAELPVPLSVFNVASQPTKDPFFPLSTRQPVTAATNSAPAFSVSEFILKGLSGSAHNRLALINNRTLADGEEAEITTVSGKIKIRCVEIKESSVLIRVGAQREEMEIFLRKSAQ